MIKRRAMTLIELLAATAIVAVLTGIALPAVSQARKKGYEPVSLSNLRQCGMSVLMYGEDHGGLVGLPPRPAADELLKKAPTCDPADYFRTSCDSWNEPPLIGSYAYARDESVWGKEDDWRQYVNLHTNSECSPALFINLFVSSERHVPSDWFGPYPANNPHPDRIQMFEADGGARLYRIRSRPDIGYTWRTLFLKR